MTSEQIRQKAREYRKSRQYLVGDDTITPNLTENDLVAFAESLLSGGAGSAVIQDARRYRRLQILGVAIGESDHLKNGTVQRFTNLDDAVDRDLKAHPSRGEAFPLADSGTPAEATPDEFPVHDYVVSICDQCIRLEGECCHNPRCRFCRRSMMEVGEYLDVLLIRPLIDGVRFDEEYAKSMRVNPAGTVSSDRVNLQAASGSGTQECNHRLNLSSDAIVRCIDCFKSWRIYSSEVPGDLRLQLRRAEQEVVALNKEIESMMSGSGTPATSSAPDAESIAAAEKRVNDLADKLIAAAVAAEREACAELLMERCRGFNESATVFARAGCQQLREAVENKANLCAHLAAAIRSRASQPTQHVHTASCYECGHDDCPCHGGYLHELPMCNPEPQGGKEADPARERTESKPVVSAMGASSPLTSGLLAPQSQPKCDCGAGDDAYLATHALDCSLRKWAMNPQTVMPASPKELAGRIAKRIGEEGFRNGFTGTFNVSKVAEIIEQELTR